MEGRGRQWKAVEGWKDAEGDVRAMLPAALPGEEGEGRWMPPWRASHPRQVLQHYLRHESHQVTGSRQDWHQAALTSRLAPGLTAE